LSLGEGRQEAGGDVVFNGTKDINQCC
jgi:hypothetical protein